MTAHTEVEAYDATEYINSYSPLYGRECSNAVRSPAAAPSPLSHHQLRQSRQAPVQQEYVEATIREINHAKGLLILETAQWVLQVQLAPEETRDLQVGISSRCRCSVPTPLCCDNWD